MNGSSEVLFVTPQDTNNFVVVSLGLSDLELIRRVSLSYINHDELNWNN